MNILIHALAIIGAVHLICDALCIYVVWSVTRPPTDEQDYDDDEAETPNEKRPLAG